MEYQITNTFKLVQVDEDHFDIISTATKKPVVMMCMDWFELGTLGNAIEILLAPSEENIAGWTGAAPAQPHKLNDAGSNPAPATKEKRWK